MPVEDTVLSAVLGQVSKRILEKLEKGKKLSTEDILLLYMDMNYTELREIKEELRETNKRIDETNKRIDSINQELPKKIEETNRRIDRLYELQAGQKSEPT